MNNFIQGISKPLRLSAPSFKAQQAIVLIYLVACIVGSTLIVLDMAGAWA